MCQHLLSEEMLTSKCSVAVIGKWFWEWLSSHGQNTSPPSYAADTYWAFRVQAFFFAPGTQQWKSPSLCSRSSHSNLSNLSLHGLQPLKPCMSSVTSSQIQREWACQLALWISYERNWDTRWSQQFVLTIVMSFLLQPLFHFQEPEIKMFAFKPCCKVRKKKILSPLYGQLITAIQNNIPPKERYW